jgi:hypothetical protein
MEFSVKKRKTNGTETKANSHDESVYRRLAAHPSPHASVVLVVGASKEGQRTHLAFSLPGAFEGWPQCE